MEIATTISTKPMQRQLLQLHDRGQQRQEENHRLGIGQRQRQAAQEQLQRLLAAIQLGAPRCRRCDRRRP